MSGPANTPSAAIIQQAQLAHDRSVESVREFNSYATASGENAVKAAGLINGGAAVAMLALVGNIADKAVVSVIDKERLTLCFILFMSGVVASAIASAMAYFVNYSHAAYNGHVRMDYIWPYVHHEPAALKWRKFGTVCHYCAVLLASYCYIVFIVAVVLARHMLVEVLTRVPS